MSDENYVEALKEIVSQTKTNIGIFGIPLILVFAQLKSLQNIEGFIVSLFATFTVVALSAGLCLSWYSWLMVHNFYSKELLLKNGNSGGKGFLYLEYLDSMFADGPVQLTEEGMLKITRFLIKPVAWCLTIGYGSMAILILSVIWISPGK